jgi:hypothetical protein
MSPDLIHQIQLYAGFPFFVLSALLGFVLCVPIILGADYLLSYGKGRIPTSPTTFFKGALVKHSWPLWLLVTSGLFLISNHLLVRGLAVGIWDVDGQYYPYQVLVADYARAGRFVHWDPWSNAGRPISGDPQVGAFSPLNFAIGFLTGGTSSGFILYWLLMWWLGGFGMLMLARHLKAPPWGGCVVALGFLFSGGYTGHAEHTSTITSFSFLPLVIWRLDSALCSHKLRPAVEAGALWGLSALAGYPALTILTGCFSALWALGRWLFPPPLATQTTSVAGSSPTEIARQPTLQFVFTVLVIVLFTGLIVLSPTYVAFFVEGAGTNARVGALSRERAVLSNALHPGALWSFASPYLPLLKLNDQMNGGNTIWSYTDVSSSSIYSGAIISALAVFALLRSPGDKWRWWLVGLGALSIACALGQTLPLRGWLYDWFYPMRFFRSAAKLRLYCLFIISVLAVIATRDLAIALRSSDDRTWKQFLVALLSVASGALLAFVFMAFTNFELVTSKIIFLLGSIHALWVWLGVCGVAFAGWVLSGRIRQWYVPALLLALAGSDAFLTNVLSIPTMVNTKPQYVKRWGELDEKHSASLDLTGNGLLREDTSCYPNPPCEFPKNDQLITKVPVFNSYATGESYFHDRMTGHPILKEMSIGTERVWFSKDVGQIPPMRSNFVAFVRRTETLGEPPLVVHSLEELLSGGAPPTEYILRGEDLLRPPNRDALNDANADQIARIGRLPAAEKIAVNLVKYLPDELVINVQCPTDGWLLVTERWARRWRAEVNGSQATVYGGNFIFRAVQVSAGQNNIRFTYHPFGFPWLVIMSWGTLAVVAICSVYSGLHSRGTSYPTLAMEAPPFSTFERKSL